MSLVMYESIFHSYLPKEEADRMCEKIDAFIKLRKIFGRKFTSLHVSRRLGIRRAEAKQLVDRELDDFDPRHLNTWVAYLLAEQSLALDELASTEQKMALT